MRKRRHVQSKITTIIRVGTPEPKTQRDYVNILATIWRQKIGRPIPADEIPLLWGLVADWPEGQAPALLSCVLDNWAGFMAGAHMEIERLGEAGFKRYYRYPSLPVIRRFYTAAVELLFDNLQWADRVAESLPLLDWLNEAHRVSW